MGKRRLPPVPTFSVNGVEISPTKRALTRGYLVDDASDSSSQSSTESMEEAPTLHLGAAGEENNGILPRPPADVSCAKPPREPPQVVGNYKVQAELGSGSFARVFRARHRADERTHVAVKFVDLRPLRLSTKADKLRLNLEREMRIMAKLPANNFTVGCLESGFVEDWCYFVLELMPLGSLHDALASRGRFHDAEASFVVSQLVDCLDFLHARGIVHRDVKPSNVLVCDRDVDASGLVSYDVKVADFGLSRQLEGADLLTLGVGSRSFMAPEIFHDRIYNAKVDFWSLGALLYALLAGHYLRTEPGSRDQESYDRAVDALRASGEARMALRGLLRVNPVQRWSQAEMRTNASVSEWLEGEVGEH